MSKKIFIANISTLFFICITSLYAQNVVMKATAFSKLNAGPVPFYNDDARKALAIDASKDSYRDKWAIAEQAFSGESDTYDITFSTMYEGDGESKYALKIDADSIGYFQNPTAWEGNTQKIKDYTIYKHTFKKVSVKKGATIKAYGMTHSNGKVPEGSGFAWSRGRWTQLDFVPSAVNTLIPNTTKETPAIRIRFNAGNFHVTTGQTGTYTARLLLTNGKEVFSTTCIATNNHEKMSIPLHAALCNGSYVIQITGKEIQVYQKVMMTR